MQIKKERKKERKKVIIFLNLLEMEYERNFQHCFYGKIWFSILCDPTPQSPPESSNYSPLVSHWSEESQLQMSCETTGSNMASWSESRTLEQKQLIQPSQGVYSCNSGNITTVSSSCLMCLDISALGRKTSFLPMLYTEYFWKVLLMLILIIFKLIIQCRKYNMRKSQTTC
jgi:hypothetical protein